MANAARRWLLWNPEVHEQLPPAFRRIVWALTMSRHPRAAASRLADLQSDILLFILNKVNASHIVPSLLGAAHGLIPKRTSRSSP